MSYPWDEPWGILNATHALDRVIANQDQLLQLGGEPFYLFQKRYEADTVVKTLGDFRPDPVVLHPRTIVWHEGLDPVEEYPDADNFAATLYTAAGEVELQLVHDKDMFASGENVCALDFHVRKVDGFGNPEPSIVYLVVNAPPHSGSEPVYVEYKWISPATGVFSKQPITVHGEHGLAGTLRGFRQWLNSERTFRNLPKPHTIPMAVPSEPRNLEVTDAGMQQESTMQWWSNVPPYAPIIVEHDILVRASTGAHYEVKDTQYDWGLGYDMGKPRLKSQMFTVHLLNFDDPKAQLVVADT